MVDYGVTPTGFVRKPYEVILQEINEYQLANVSPSLDVSPESPQGQLNASMARQIAALWEQGEVMFHALDPDAAEGFLLQNIAKLTGTGRRAASFSRVTAQVTANAGTILQAGVHFANIDGDPENQWTPVEDFEAPSTGTHDVLFRAAETGPVQANANTLTVITTSVTGWDSIDNAAAATEGLEADDDSELRLRREADLARAGSGTRLAIQADVAAVADDLGNTVNTVIVFENKLDYTVDGIPPHAVEVVVDDGDPPAVADDLIAQAIFDSTGAGIQWSSQSGDSGTATDEEGTEYTVPFTRVSFVDIHLAYELETGPGYVGDAAVKQYVRDQGLELFGDIGNEIVALRLEALPLDLEGVLDVTAFNIGIIGPASGTDNIELGNRQKAAFDVADIDITTV